MNKKKLVENLLSIISRIDAITNTAKTPKQIKVGNIGIVKNNTPTLALKCNENYYSVGINSPTVDTDAKKRVIKLLEPYISALEIRKAYDQFDNPFTRTGKNRQNIRIKIQCKDIENVIYAYAGVKKVNMEQQFREYLENHTELTIATINVYAVALRLGDDFDGVYNAVRDAIEFNNFYEIQDIGLFLEQYGLIEDIMPNQHNTNGNGHDNGNLSAALRKYQSFLETLGQNTNTQGNENMIDEKSRDKVENMPPSNQILYGPPGTGKTYSTVGKALEILGGSDTKITSIGKLKEEFGSQVEFVTFHQSFSYEDFVEGLKAKTDDGRITYEIKNGIFKEICNNASSKAEMNTTSTIGNDATIWKMSLGEYGRYFNEAVDSNSLILGWGGNNNFSECKNQKELLKIDPDGGGIVNSFIFKMKIGDIVIISDGNYKFKAIAKITGKYYFDEESELPQRRKIEWLQIFSQSRSVLDISEKNFTQLTINKPKHVNKEKLQCYLTDAQDAKDSDQKPYVLIIDEINRGNISRIFGELITLIEPSKRAGADEEISVKLPYSKESFSVPSNLYIIGTMNTADRSLALMDTALRRRFDFVEMMPNSEWVKGNFDGIEVKKILEKINDRIEVLYDREHTIGHSFLMNIEDLEGLQNAFKNKILPLLEEYFYDDFEKIILVLGGGTNFYKKIEKTLGEFSKTIFTRQNVEQLEAKAFIQIYTPQGSAEPSENNEQ